MSFIQRLLLIRLNALSVMLMAALLGGAGPVLGSEAIILRDRNHVPHIYGPSNAAVFHGFGYAMAEDRLFQMEMRKRQALGRVAEVLGKGDRAWPDKYLAKDQAARLMMEQAKVPEGFADLGFDDQALIMAFTDGVNRRIEEVLADRSKLPRPFIDHDFLPELWSPLDSLSVAVDVLAAYASFSTELPNLALYEHLRKTQPEHCDDIFDQFLWRTDPNAPTTLRDHQQGGPNPDQAEPRGCGAAPNGLRLAGDLALTAPRLPEDLEPRRASMNWAVGSDMARNATAIMLAGPQPGWHNPSYYYAVGLHGGDFDLVGFAAEGSLVLQLGVNGRFSWGSTAGLGNQVAHYQEVRDAPHGERYLHKNAWRPFERKTQVIKVKGEKDHVFVTEASLHGVIVDGDRDGRHAYARAVAWQGAAVSSVMDWVHAARAQSHEEWLGRARDFAFGLNWFYAGRDGRVGFAFTGRYPILAAGHDHRLPASGTGGYEWQGLLPRDANPWSLTRGYVVNFNNKPAKDWPNSGLYWEQWAEANQVDILLDAFAGRDNLDAREMWEINRIVAFTDVSARYFMPHLAAAAKNLPEDGDLARAAALMLDWNKRREDTDGDGLYDHAGLTLFDAWLPRLVQHTLGATLKGFPQAKIWLAAGYQRGAPRLEEHPSAGTLATHHALQSRAGQSGVHHHHDFFAGADPRDVILRALSQALADLRQHHKGPMAQWRSPVVPQVFFDSNTNRIPITSPGIKMTLPAYANRGAVNMLVTYGPAEGPAKAGYVLPPGQSAFIPPDGAPGDNPFLADHLAIYGAFGLAPLHLDPKRHPYQRGGADPVRLQVNDYRSKL